MPTKLVIAVGTFVAWTASRLLLEGDAGAIAAIHVLFLICLLEASERTRAALLLLGTAAALVRAVGVGLAMLEADFDARALAPLAYVRAARESGGSVPSLLETGGRRGR
jgi:hypothetical protein